MKPEEITSLLEETSMEDVQNLVKYLKIQKAESYAITHGQTRKEIVENYLNKMSELDPTLAAVYPTNADGKGIDDCMLYLEDNALKMVTQRTGVQTVQLPSFTVFEWAERYFLDPEVKKFEKAKPAPAPVYKPKKRTLKDLQKAKAEWEAENSRKIQEWEVDNNAKIDAFEREHASDLFPPENPHCKNVNPYLEKTFPDQAELDALLQGKETPVEDEPETNEEDIPEEDPVDDAVGEIKPVSETPAEDPQAHADDGTTNLPY